MAREESTVTDFLAPKAVVLEKKNKGRVAAVEIDEQLKELRQQMVDLHKGIAAVITKPQAAATKAPKTTCFRCGKEGHWAKECRTRSAPGKLDSRKRSVCFRCRMIGHVAKNCRTAPPNTPCPVCGGNHWRYDCRVAPKANQDPTPPLN